MGLQKYPMIRKNPFISGIISFIPAARISFRLLNSSPVLVVMINPASVFSFHNFCLHKTVQSDIVLPALLPSEIFPEVFYHHASESYVNVGSDDCKAFPPSIINTFRKERPRLIADDNPA